ncbi:MAG: HPr family phosphocarrier protein [Ruminococcus sp.]|nr:HPr family phosphocarrier protein [Ruminococcus sp.]
MVKAYIKLNNLNDVQKFHSVASSCSYDLIMESGSMRINAKSLMGVMCLACKNVSALIAKSNDRTDFRNKFEEFFAR